MNTQKATAALWRHVHEDYKKVLNTINRLPDTIRVKRVWEELDVTMTSLGNSINDVYQADVSGANTSTLLIQSIDNLGVDMERVCECVLALASKIPNKEPE